MRKKGSARLRKNIYIIIRSILRLRREERESARLRREEMRD